MIASVFSSTIFEVAGTYGWYLSFYECMLSGGDAKTLPAVIKSFCTHSQLGC